MCQKRANISFLNANLSINMPTYQRRANCSNWHANVPKVVPIFQLFFKRKYFSIFQLWFKFANFKNIWTIPENLSRKTKTLNYDICLFLLTYYKSCFSYLSCTPSCKLITIFTRNGKKYSHNNHNTVFYNYLRSPTQADHSSRRSQYSHVFSILLSCFNCGKFKKTLVCYLQNIETRSFLYFYFSSWR